MVNRQGSSKFLIDLLVLRLSVEMIAQAIVESANFLPASTHYFPFRHYAQPSEPFLREVLRLDFRHQGFQDAPEGYRVLGAEHRRRPEQGDHLGSGGDSDFQGSLAMSTSPIFILRLLFGSATDRLRGRSCAPRFRASSLRGEEIQREEFLPHFIVAARPFICEGRAGESPPQWGQYSLPALTPLVRIGRP
jgi:hypothetical protein